MSDDQYHLKIEVRGDSVEDLKTLLNTAIRDWEKVHQYHLTTANADKGYRRRIVIGSEAIPHHPGGHFAYRLGTPGGGSKTRTKDVL